MSAPPLAPVRAQPEKTTHSQFLSIKKLTGNGIVEVAARHNHREILVELGATNEGNIDPARGGLNRVLRGHGTAAAVAGQAHALMDAAGVTATRKDAVRALEIIFSLPPGSSIDHDRFFNEAVEWAEQYFAIPVISAIVHNDEAAPHCHVLLLPLVDGRMVGSDLMGGRAKLQALQADFHAQVGKWHGLTRQAAQKPPDAEDKRKAIDLAFGALEVNSGLNGAVLRALLGPHTANPGPLLRVLGLAAPGPENTFAGIMTKPCKTGISKGLDGPNPIGFGGSKTPEKWQTLSCVGFGKFDHHFSPPTEPETSASQGHENRFKPQAGNACFAPPNDIASAPAVLMAKGSAAPKYPKLFMSARADVLAAWLSPDDPAGADRVLRGSLCLDTVVRALIRKYHWRAERRDIKADIGDGRAAWASVYCLPQEVIDAALCTGGREWLTAYREAQAARSASRKLKCPAGQKAARP